MIEPVLVFFHHRTLLLGFVDGMAGEGAYRSNFVRSQESGPAILLAEAPYKEESRNPGGLRLSFFLR
jgi:hypothetical protein